MTSRICPIAVENCPGFHYLFVFYALDHIYILVIKIRYVKRRGKVIGQNLQQTPLETVNHYQFTDLILTGAGQDEEGTPKTERLHKSQESLHYINYLK